MARLPYLDLSDLAQQDHDLLARDINLHRLLAHTPAGARAFGKLSHWIRHASELDARLRELVILQIGYSSDNAYEFSHHIRIGRQFGVSDEDIQCLIDETEGRPSNLTSLERTALTAAREMIQKGRIGELTFTALKTLLSPQALVELVIIGSFYVGVVHLLASLDIDVEADYLPHLSEFPLPASEL
jgi:alkylhydroperoxidase family enzyme